MDDQVNHQREYFATLKIEDLLPELVKKTDNYYKYLQESGRMSIWRRSYECYYRNMFRGGKMNRAGNEGEYTTINVNHARNVLLHIKNMTTKQIPALTPQAANTDYKSMAQTIIASGILEYYVNEKSLADIVDIAIEDCSIFGESYVSSEWDQSEGEDFAADPETGQIFKTGDVIYGNFTPMDVIIDFAQPDPEHHDWHIIRKYKNKYSLASKYPHAREKILDTNMDDSRLRDQRIGMMTLQQSDLIPVYTFFHKKTPSMPNGRLVEFITSETFLFDGEMPYRQTPLYRVSAMEQRGTCFGYTVMFDLLPIQEAVDGLYSTIITNQSNYGVQNIWVDAGSGITVSQLAGGLNLIQSKTKPEPINLTSTPAEIFKFLEMLVHDLETISGVNSVTRGNPEASLKSGAALALVASMAIEFNSGLQKSYAQLWKKLGTSTINHLKDFPMTKRNIVISGKNNRSYMSEFQKDDLKDIDLVTCDLGNPLSRTTAGKVDMADNLLQRGLIKEPEQYIEVLTTGKLEPVYQNPQAEKMLIRAENEKLMEGQPVSALATDQHTLHIMEHKTVLASPESRESKAVPVTLKHIDDHITMLRTIDPVKLQAMGQQPLPPPQPPMPPQLPAPQAPPRPEGAGNTPGAVMKPTTSLQEQAEKVNMPNMPTNPMTGQQFKPETGGAQ